MPHGDAASHPQDEVRYAPGASVASGPSAERLAFAVATDMSYLPATLEPPRPKPVRRRGRRYRNGTPGRRRPRGKAPSMRATSSSLSVSCAAAAFSRARSS